MDMLITLAVACFATTTTALIANIIIRTIQVKSYKENVSARYIPYQFIQALSVYIILIFWTFLSWPLLTNDSFEIKCTIGIYYILSLAGTIFFNIRLKLKN